MCDILWHVNPLLGKARNTAAVLFLCLHSGHMRSDVRPQQRVTVTWRVFYLVRARQQPAG
jgi:hypothetical protein